MPSSKSQSAHYCLTPVTARIPGTSETVGLLMAAEKTHGIPVLSQIYQPNRHDRRVFSCVLADIVMTLQAVCDQDADIVIVLDKGNNSKENFAKMNGAISWVGSLVPSRYKELTNLELSEYHGSWGDLRYYRTQKRIVRIECAVVLTYNSATARKQEHSLQRGLDKLRNAITTKWVPSRNRRRIYHVVSRRYKRTATMVPAWRSP